MAITGGGTALAFTQTDFLSPATVAWELGGKSVEPNRNVAHIEQLAAAKQAGIPVFVSEQASMPQRLPSAPIWVMGMRPRPTRFVAGAVLTTVQAFAA